MCYYSLPAISTLHLTELDASACPRAELVVKHFDVVSVANAELEVIAKPRADLVSAPPDAVSISIVEIVCAGAPPDAVSIPLKIKLRCREIVQIQISV